MSNLPRAAKIQALHDIGAKIDDGLEQAKIQTARRDGTRNGQTEAINHLISNCKDPSLDKNTVQHCIKLIQQLQTQSNMLYYMTLGAEKQCEAHVAMIKKMYDLEIVLKTREETLPTPEEIGSRPAPPRTLKEMRLAQEAHSACVEDNKSPDPPEARGVKEEKEPESEIPIPDMNDNKNSPKTNKKKQSLAAPQGVSTSDATLSLPPKKEIRKKRNVKSSN